MHSQPSVTTRTVLFSAAPASTRFQLSLKTAPMAALCNLDQTSATLTHVLVKRPAIPAAAASLPTAVTCPTRSTPAQAKVLFLRLIQPAQAMPFAPLWLVETISAGRTILAHVLVPVLFALVPSLPTATCLPTLSTVVLLVSQSPARPDALTEYANPPDVSAPALEPSVGLRSQLPATFIPTRCTHVSMARHPCWMPIAVLRLVSVRLAKTHACARAQIRY